MSVYIFDADAFDKLVQLEGAFWGQIDDSFELNKRNWETFNSRKHLSDDDRDAYSFNSIHGAGGMNRYIVHGSGEIVILQRQSSDVAVSLAKQLGFTVG